MEWLDFIALGFTRSEPASTGQPGYDPRDLLRLYIYGYLNEVRSSRRLERECRRNMEVMWLVRRLAPDFKTIADFRRDNGAALAAACRAPEFGKTLYANLGRAAGQSDPNPYALIWTPQD